MLEIHFEGWFQCRLATNPDPTDEPRGVSGYTFALAGEPDLDRVIRLHDPVASRSHGPPVGVRVTRVVLDGVARPDHALVGGAVDFLERAKFESRNMLLGEDRGGAGIIDPFVLRVSGGGVTVVREDVLDPHRPEAPLHALPPSVLDRRSPLEELGAAMDPTRIAEATGIDDPAAFRAHRRRALEADLRVEEDVVERAALEKRILELSIEEPENARTVFMSAVQTRKFGINGPAQLLGDVAALGLEPDVERDWPVEFWMGGWDADALCGYMRGVLGIQAVGPHGAGRLLEDGGPASV